MEKKKVDGGERKRRAAERRKAASEILLAKRHAPRSVALLAKMTAQEREAVWPLVTAVAEEFYAFGHKEIADKLERINASLGIGSLPDVLKRYGLTGGAS